MTDFSEQSRCVCTTIMPGVIAAAMFAASVGSVDAQARRDGKVYPGTFCQVAENSDTGSGAIRYGKLGMALNNSDTNRMRVTCPIIRDEINTNRGIEVKVFFHDSHPNQALACDLIETNLMANTEIRRDSFSVGEFRPVNVNLGRICNKALIEDFPEIFRVPDLEGGVCQRTLSTSNSQREARDLPGSAYVLHCGIPPRSTNADFADHNPPLSQTHVRAGRSGIAAYYVTETTQ